MLITDYLRQLRHKEPYHSFRLYGCIRRLPDGAKMTIKEFLKLNPSELSQVYGAGKKTVLYMRQLQKRLAVDFQAQSGRDDSENTKKPQKTTLEEIEDIIEEFTFASDEWGGNKIANWRYGNNLVVDGITEAAEAILRIIKTD